MKLGRFACCLMLFLLMTCQSQAEKQIPFIGQQFEAHDTLETGEETIEDAQQCLESLGWTCTDFPVKVTVPGEPDREDALVRFPSPVPSENPVTEQVVMEWYMVANGAQVISAPAVVVVHESGRHMTAGRLIAQGFRQRGIHAFLIQLPGYGERRPKSEAPKMSVLETMRQGIADVRRARDAVAALPFIETGCIALQGTSLGGFVASNTVGIDHAYDKAFLLLSGGDIYTVLQNGDREASRVREKLAEKGLTPENIREIAWQVEPNRLAHRIDPERTWLYSGVYDSVVPIANAKSFAKAARLSESHHIMLPVNHYAGIFLLPGILDRMSDEILNCSNKQ